MYNHLDESGEDWTLDEPYVSEYDPGEGWFCEHGWFQRGKKVDTCTHYSAGEAPTFPLDRPLRIYVASSWRNERYPTVVEFLRSQGHEVYDFRHDGFSWEEVGLHGSEPDVDELLDIHYSEKVQRQFAADFEALEWCDVLVCVLPCGRSAHMELGWAVGKGKPTFLLWKPSEPDIMHLMCTEIVESLAELELVLKELSREPGYTLADTME